METQDSATSLLRLSVFLTEDDMDAARQLASSLGAELHECPTLMRALEDAVLVKLYTEFRTAGEGKRNATRRAARQAGLDYENSRYRLESMGHSIRNSTKSVPR